MKILDKVVTIEELREIATNSFGDLVKVVVDVDRGLVAIDAELHSDLEAIFLENGSQQKSLWGINFYPFLESGDFIEFDSLINMRPSQGNMIRGVHDELTRQKIIEIANRWVKR
ncbi:DUF5674 family protein [Candidatus Omnitrophota bacterium]